MANFYTLIAHHEQASRDDFYFHCQLEKKHLSIGWGEVNPVGSTPEKINADIQRAYPNAVGTNNPWNGAESLPVFCKLVPGDLVFVRGDAKILDIAVVTGTVPYSYGHGQYDNGYDYCTTVPFIPLLDNVHAGILTREIPDEHYYNVLEDRGRRLVMRKIHEPDARGLLKAIVNLF